MQCKCSDIFYFKLDWILLLSTKIIFILSMGIIFSNSFQFYCFMTHPECGRTLSAELSVHGGLLSLGGGNTLIDSDWNKV